MTSRVIRCFSAIARTANLALLRASCVIVRMATYRTSSRLAAKVIKRSASPQAGPSAAIPLPVLPVTKLEKPIEPPKKRRKITKAKAESDIEDEIKPAKMARKKKEDAVDAPDDEPKPVKKPRKKKSDLPESFPARFKGDSKKYIGSHCSAAGGKLLHPIQALWTQSTRCRVLTR